MRERQTDVLLWRITNRTRQLPSNGIDLNYRRNQSNRRSRPMTKTSTHPTLSQVARKAGVGTTTVSRVINGGDRVSPETLAHVRRVIESLGYMPSQAARTLKGQRTKTIGLVIPSIADPFFSSLAEAAQRPDTPPGGWTADCACKLAKPGSTRSAGANSSSGCRYRPPCRRLFDRLGGRR